MVMDPCIKFFGARRPFRGARGWGHWEGERWIQAISKEDTTSLGGLDCDDHDSRFYIKLLEHQLELSRRDRMAAETKALVLPPHGHEGGH